MILVSPISLKSDQVDKVMTDQCMFLIFNPTERWNVD